MKWNHNTEFYVGAGVWLLTILIAYVFWLNGDPNVQLALSPANLAVAGTLFGLYLGGYLVSHGVLGDRPGRSQKTMGILVSAVATTFLSAFVFFFGMMGCMAMMVIVQLATLVSRRWAMAAAVAIPVAFVFADYWLDKDYEPTNIAVYGIVNVLALLTSYRAIAERDAKLESQQLVRELKATQMLLSATSKRDERLRIARNLHDILGHQLTALSLQLEVANHVEGEAKAEHIMNAQNISSSLLSNVRETVSEFREENDLSLREAMSVLAEGIPGLQVAVSLDWDDSLPNERQIEVLFRCAQEALTNIAKHSDATRCDILVSNDEKNLTLDVRDNGRSTNEIKPGNGLRGMLERVQRIDGELGYANGSDGFVLSIKLPLAQ